MYFEAFYNLQNEFISGNILPNEGIKMITIKDVEHVAKLARLELTEDEKAKFTTQLGDVLKYVDQMNEVDTTGVEPMAHAIDFVNVMRDDAVK